MFDVGDFVKKKEGYRYEGIVVSIFDKLHGEVRCVVECTVNGCETMLHVFNMKNLEKCPLEWSVGEEVSWNNRTGTVLCKWYDDKLVYYVVQDSLGRHIMSEEELPRKK